MLRRSLLSETCKFYKHVVMLISSTFVEFDTRELAVPVTYSTIFYCCNAPNLLFVWIFNAFITFSAQSLYAACECINLKKYSKMYMRVVIANLRCEFGRSEPPSSWSLSAFFVKKNKKLIYAVINIRGHIFYKVQSGGALHLSATDSLPFFATPLKHYLAKCCLLLVNIFPLIQFIFALPSSSLHSQLPYCRM